MFAKSWVGPRPNCRNRIENQQTQPTYDAEAENWTRDTLVEGERSHHCANPAPFLLLFCLQLFKL